MHFKQELVQYNKQNYAVLPPCLNIANKKMTGIGNLLLLIATIIYAVLVNVLYFKTLARRGDQAIGYVWGLIFINAVLIITILVAYAVIAAKGGFQWISHQPAARFFTVSFSLLTALATVVLSSLFKDEPGPVNLLVKYLSKLTPLIIPAVLIAAGFILLNNISVTSAVYKWPLFAVAMLGIIGISSYLLLFIQARSANIKAVQDEVSSFEEKNRQRIMQEIDTCDITKNLVFIFVFTDANQDEVIRTKALAKIKLNPQWQQELVNRLQNDWAPEAFNFLASNPVDDPSLFFEPIKKGILIQAKLIRESIRSSTHPSHLYQTKFSWEIERVMRTVEKFKTKDYNYVAEVKELRAALDEPVVFDKPVFESIAFLDNWVKAHQ